MAGCLRAMIAAGNDAAGNDAAGNDAAGNDAAGNDAAGNDAAGNDAAGNDAARAGRASGLRRWVSVGLVAVVAGALAGGLAWVAASQKVVTTVSPATPQRLVVVPEAAGLYQVSSPQLGAIASAAREGLTRAGTPNAVAAFYGPSAVGDPSVFVAGGSAAAGATGNAALHTQLSQITAAARERGAALGPLRAYDAGAPGGALECQSVTGGALSAVCAWSDADTVAVVSSPALPVQDLAVTTADLRTALKQPVTGSPVAPPATV